MTMTTLLKPLPAAYERTLADLHRLAVYVVSPAQRLVNGDCPQFGAASGLH